MSEFTNPTDIARETLRLLATRRIAPTPDNYQKLYLEIAGLPAGAVTPGGAEQVLELITADLRDRPNGALASAPLDKALAEKDWQRYRSLLLDLLANKSDKSPVGAPVWAKLVLDLIKQWEARHSGLTLARKRESLEKVLALPGADPAKLAKKLQNLVKSWSDTAPAPASSAGDAPPLPPDAAGAPPAAHRTYGQEPMPDAGKPAEDARRDQPDARKRGNLPAVARIAGANAGVRRRLPAQPCAGSRPGSSRSGQDGARRRRCAWGGRPSTSSVRCTLIRSSGWRGYKRGSRPTRGG